MNEPCVCGGSGVNGGGPCHWCSAGTIPRALLRVVMDPNVGYLTSETQNLISEAYSVIRADPKDTTQTHEKPWDYREAKGVLSLPEPPEDTVRRSRGHGTHE